MPKTRMMLGKKLIFFEERFLTSTDWTAPPGCTEVDVFLVGGGAGGAYGGGGGGYTKTFKKNTTGWRDGGAIKVTSGQTISIIVGVGGSPGGMSGPGADGQYSQFMNSTYRAEGGVLQNPIILSRVLMAVLVGLDICMQSAALMALMEDLVACPLVGKGKGIQQESLASLLENYILQEGVLTMEEL